LSTIYTLLGEVHSTGHVSPAKKAKHEERIILDDHANYVILIRKTVHDFFLNKFRQQLMLYMRRLNLILKFLRWAKMGLQFFQRQLYSYYTDPAARQFCRSTYTITDITIKE
jgi:hypothetical protein